MSTRIEVSGEVLADRVREFARTTALPASDEWVELLDAEWPTTFSGNVAERGYWVDLYRRRQENAAALDTGLADGLAKVVRELSEFDGDLLVFVMVDALAYTHFVWLSLDLSRVVSCFRAKDKRYSAPVDEPPHNGDDHMDL